MMNQTNFRSMQESLESVRRFDRVVKARSVDYGEMEDERGQMVLAVEAGGQAMALNPHATSQAAGRFQIPADHFTRLPRELQVAELRHFSRKAGVDDLLTLRGYEGRNGAEMARAFLSGRYAPFDSHHVLEVAAPILTDDMQVSWQNLSRDEMGLQVLFPQQYDVGVNAPKSARGAMVVREGIQLDDVVQMGLTIRNSEIGTMSLATVLSSFRLRCLNGLCIEQSEVSIKQRHIYVSREGFRIQLANALRTAKEMAPLIIEQQRQSRALLLPNLDPSEGGLQRAVQKVLDRNKADTQKFRKLAEEEMADREGNSLFGLVQFVTGPKYAKAEGVNLAERLRRERIGGDLLALAAA